MVKLAKRLTKNREGLDRTKLYGLDEAVWCRTMPYEIASNWKLVVENYLETLHLNFIHTLLAEVAPFEEHAVIAEGNCLGTIIDVGLPENWAPDAGLPENATDFELPEPEFETADTVSASN